MPAASAGGSEAIEAAAGRVGASAVYVADARGLLPASAAAPAGPAPGLLVFGGAKADESRHSDLALLLLPAGLEALAREAEAGDKGQSGEDFAFAQAVPVETQASFD